MSEDPPVCRPDDLVLTLRWERSGDGLSGQVIAENVGDHACYLPGKPNVIPLGMDGQRLDTQMIVSLEARIPGYVVLQPGQRAVARVDWSAWCGRPASRRAIVGWDRGSVTVDVDGPAQPSCRDAPDNLTSSWFKLLE